MNNYFLDPLVAKEIASYLLEIEAIKLSPNKPFTWASGWNSPIYCDNRTTLSFPEVRTRITTQLVATIRKQYPDAEVIAGVATAGIPQAAIIANEMNLPMIYVRPKAKGHGMTNLIEGKLEKGQKVVVIEDLVSTGGSSLKAVEDLRDAGADVVGMAAIFTYGFPIADKNFEDHKTNLACLSDYTNMLEQASLSGFIEDEEIPVLKKWRESPETWKV